MPRPLIAVAALLAATGAASAATDAELRAFIVGTWGQMPTCTADILTFKADGTFTSGEAGDAAMQAGTYRIENGKLSGEAGGSPMPVATLSIEGDHLVFENADGTRDVVNRCK